MRGFPACRAVAPTGPKAVLPHPASTRIARHGTPSQSHHHSTPRMCPVDLPAVEQHERIDVDGHHRARRPVPQRPGLLRQRADGTQPSRLELVLLIGDAGTGKTRSIKTAFDAIRQPVEMLAPSVEASRGVLRAEGFAQADAVASFLRNTDRQQAVRGGVIWIDEAGLLPIKDLSRLTEVAREQQAHIVLMGDDKQHASPARHGNMMAVLQEYAGLKVGRLTEVWRQQHQGYKRVVADIAAGGRSQGFDGLVHLGWAQTVDDNTPLVDEYMAGLHEEQLVIAPTHAQGDEVTAAIRERLKAEKVIGDDERVFDTLRPLAWTEAERADPLRYQGSEVLQFHRNSGPYKAGDRVNIADREPGTALSNPAHFSVYRPERTALADGVA